ncbi:S-adenosyl-L-methionine-dependent methyltransferase [Baffinella frigidus]|nr:S-adenosyl-L-methionine-dependent methyltransferase [Cryptophyta sp. CCMP2293]
MKNHFFFPYSGNKRQEVERLYDTFKDRIDDIKTIIEPYCGSCAFSYYIWTQNKDKDIKYILNDMDFHLIELLRMAKDRPDELQMINEDINEFCKTMTKETYDIKKKDGVGGYILGNLYYYIHPKTCPVNQKVGHRNILNCPFMDFLQNANIEISEKDGLGLVKEYVDDKHTMLFLDPPYILSCNAMYKNKSTDIYKFFSKNDLKAFQSHMLICLELNFITELIFDIEDLNIYDKTYEAVRSKTKHFIYYNKQE